MHQNLVIIAFVAMILPAGASVACYANADCAIGNTCVKVSEENNGNELRPVHPTNDASLKDGNTCTVDSDCGPEARCEKKGVFIEGVCVSYKETLVPAVNPGAAGSARPK